MFANCSGLPAVRVPAVLTNGSRWIPIVGRPWDKRSVLRLGISISNGERTRTIGRRSHRARNRSRPSEGGTHDQSIRVDSARQFVWYNRMSNDIPGAEKLYRRSLAGPCPRHDERPALCATSSRLRDDRRPDANSEDAARWACVRLDGLYRGRRRQDLADKVKATDNMIHRRRPRFPMSPRSLSPSESEQHWLLVFKGNGEQPPTQDPSRAWPHRLA